MYAVIKLLIICKTRVKKTLFLDQPIIPFLLRIIITKEFVWTNQQQPGYFELNCRG